MPITSFTIEGQEVNPLYNTFEVRETVGGVSTLSCEIISVGSPVQRFSRFNEVVIQEDGVTIFAGTITQTREKGFGGPNIYDDEAGAPQIATTITAEDYTRIAERVYVTETIAEGTSLEAFLTTLVDNWLDQFGVTLHPSQVTGPSLPALTFDRKRASEVLQALSDATGFLSRIDYDLQLRMWEEGELVAPFDIDEFDDPPRWTGDVEVETILGDDYANRVHVVMEPVSEVGRAERFTGDGVTSTFTLQYTLTRHYGIIHIYQLDGITPAGGETFGIPPEGPIQWAYDPVTNTITKTDGPTSALGIYELRFDGTFEASAVAEDAGEIAANGLYEHVERRTDITSEASAQDLADSLLAERLGAGDQVVVYESRYTAPGLRAGQQQQLTATARDISGDFIIRDLRVRAEVPATEAYAVDGLGLIRSVTVKQQKVMVGKWQHTYRDWLKVGTGASVPSVGDAGPSPAAAAPPVAAVQFNRLGGFGGDASFTYLEGADSIICGGGGSSITASNPVSCQVFGFNNHIED